MLTVLTSQAIKCNLSAMQTDAISEHLHSPLDKQSLVQSQCLFLLRLVRSLLEPPAISVAYQLC